MADELRVLAPLPGRVLPLSEVPDPVFAGAMVGPGAAVDPPRGPVQAVAPVDGRIAKLHPHAFVVVTSSGRGVLVHLGIDTVQLQGEGFRLLAAEVAIETSETGPTSCQPDPTSDSPSTSALMIGLRTNAAGGMVSMAPTIAPITPKPRKSLRVMGSFCSSATLRPF